MRAHNTTCCVRIISCSSIHIVTMHNVVMRAHRLRLKRAPVESFFRQMRWYDNTKTRSSRCTRAKIIIIIQIITVAITIVITIVKTIIIIVRPSPATNARVRRKRVSFGRVYVQRNDNDDDTIINNWYMTVDVGRATAAAAVGRRETLGKRVLLTCRRVFTDRTFVFLTPRANTHFTATAFVTTSVEPRWRTNCYPSIHRERDEREIKFSRFRLDSKQMNIVVKMEWMFLPPTHTSPYSNLQVLFRNFLSKSTLF